MDIITEKELRHRRGLPAVEPNPTLKFMDAETQKIYSEMLSPPNQYFVIDPFANLYLLAAGGGCVVAFADAFLEAWKRVGEDRPRLVAFWDNAGPQAPSLKLESDLSLIGKYDAKQHLFGFNTEAMELAIKADMLLHVIGHELGHGWCHTDPASAMSNPGAVTPELLKAREDEANAKAAAWGFDMRALEHWGNANRKRFAEMTKNPAYLNEFTPVV